MSPQSVGEQHREMSIGLFVGFVLRTRGSALLCSQVPEEAYPDVLGVPEPERDERRGRAAVQLRTHPQATHAKRRLRRECLLFPDCFLL